MVRARNCLTLTMHMCPRSYLKYHRCPIVEPTPKASHLPDVCPPGEGSEFDVVVYVQSSADHRYAMTTCPGVQFDIQISHVSILIRRHRVCLPAVLWIIMIKGPNMPETLGGTVRWHLSSRTEDASHSSIQPTECTQRTSHQIHSMQDKCLRPDELDPSLLVVLLVLRWYHQHKFPIQKNSRRTTWHVVKA